MDKEMYHLTRCYQMVFGGEAGHIVLADILSMLGFFSNNPERINPERIAVANTILSRLNVYSSESVNDYVKNMLGKIQMPIMEKEKKDE